MKTLPFTEDRYHTCYAADRNHYVRLFNRLETAIRRHIEAKEASGFSDEADDELAAAHRSVMKHAAIGPFGET